MLFSLLQKSQWQEKVAAGIPQLALSDLPSHYHHQQNPLFTKSDHHHVAYPPPPIASPSNMSAYLASPLFQTTSDLHSRSSSLSSTDSNTGYLPLQPHQRQSLMQSLLEGSEPDNSVAPTYYGAPIGYGFATVTVSAG
jgi:hypothetical protein